MALDLAPKEQRALQQDLLRAGLRFQSLVARKSPVNTGSYRASWQTVQNSDGSVSVKNTTGLTAYLEFGTDPHTPPLAPIKQWARRQIGVTGEELDSVAWAVVNKIAKEGTEPQPHFRPAVDEFTQGEGYSVRGR